MRQACYQAGRSFERIWSADIVVAQPTPAASTISSMAATQFVIHVLATIAHSPSKATDQLPDVIAHLSLDTPGLHRLNSLPTEIGSTEGKRWLS